ncbi:uncharacterized protein [Clytia hemisphaerica]|uniref:uncharacterized protein n=1 Tax=Clytia hemisphaerica TaxID=252671 RepID=UPI0034D5C4C2
MNESFLESHERNVILQQNELRNNQQHLQQLQNNRDDEPAVISEENNTQNHQREVRMKWTKNLNSDVIRCFFNTILRYPDAPYRKEFHRRWEALHPEIRCTEQKICDRKQVITKKVNTRENTRGSWLTELEIQQIRNEIQDEIDNERNQPRNQLTEQPEAETGPEHEQPPENEPPRQPEEEPENIEILDENQPEEDELLQLKERLLENYAYSIVTPFEERYNFKKPNKKTLKTLEKSLGKVNKVLEDATVLTDISDVNQLNNLTYAAAITAINEISAQKCCIYRKTNKKQRKGDNWVFNMKMRIDNIRGDVSRVSQMRDPNPSTKMKKNNNNAMRQKYNITDEYEREVILETLKQRMLALNNRLSRYQKRQTQFRQNNDFIEKPSKLFDELRGNKTEVKDPPSKESIEQFWKPMYETRKCYNKESVWLQQYEESIDAAQSEYSDITPDEVMSATNKFANWKSPGIDKIQNFWWCNLPNIHAKFAELSNNTIVDPTTCPKWLTTGRTTLISKKPPTQNPSNYRTIDQLPVYPSCIKSSQVS